VAFLCQISKSGFKLSYFLNTGQHVHSQSLGKKYCPFKNTAQIVWKILQVKEHEGDNSTKFKA